MTTFTPQKQFHSRQEVQRQREARGRARKPWSRRSVSARLEARGGEWYVILRGRDGVEGDGAIATDAEVALWKELEETRAALAQLQETQWPA